MYVAEKLVHIHTYIQYMYLCSLSISHVKENLYMAWEQSYEYINNQQTISFLKKKNKQTRPRRYAKSPTMQDVLVGTCPQKYILFHGCNISNIGCWTGAHAGDKAWVDTSGRVMMWLSFHGGSLYCLFKIVVEVGQSSGDWSRYQGSLAVPASWWGEGTVLLTRVRYREKSPAPKVTGGCQGSGSRRASHGKVDHISGRKENTSELLLTQHAVLTYYGQLCACILCSMVRRLTRISLHCKHI